MSSLGLLLSNLPARWIGGVSAGDGPETPNIRIGIIALTDTTVTEETTCGACFLPFHWAGKHGFFKATNNLTVTARYPVSHQPELRACAVRVRKVLNFPVGDN